MKVQIVNGGSLGNSYTVSVIDNETGLMEIETVWESNVEPRVAISIFLQTAIMRIGHTNVTVSASIFNA